MPKIYVKDNEPIDRAMRRFKNMIDDLDLIRELRSRESYEKPTTERKRKKAAAVSRFKREQSRQTLPPKLY